MSDLVRITEMLRNVTKILQKYYEIVTDVNELLHIHVAQFSYLYSYTRA